jgi:hypothetical protein
VYDMYPWDKRSADSGRPATRSSTRAVQVAVQVALDRRDNGGDPAAASATPPAGPTRQ